MDKYLKQLELAIQRQEESEKEIAELKKHLSYLEGKDEELNRKLQASNDWIKDTREKMWSISSDLSEVKQNVQSLKNEARQIESNKKWLEDTREKMWNISSRVNDLNKNFTSQKNMFENKLKCIEGKQQSLYLENKRRKVENANNTEVAEADVFEELKIFKQDIEMVQQSDCKVKKVITKENPVYFKAFDIQPGRIEFVTNHGGETKKAGEEQKIFFQLDENVLPSNDAIAYAISTLVGCTYDYIELDLPIRMKTKENIESFTKATVDAPTNNEEEPIREGKNVLLNFSGGFDSLAALYLMPENTKLVSVDFGGWFEQEAVFFEKFHPYILKTNFRQLKMDRESWTYMGVGAILYSEYLDIGYNVFGAILEADTRQMRLNSPLINSYFTEPFGYLGLKDIRYMNGMTEIGTALVVTYYGPDMIKESLVSLAKPKTEKRYRKEIITDIICEKFGREIHFERTALPEQKYYYGMNMALDFLYLYIGKNRGIEEMLNTYEEVPEDAIALINELDLTFYERINCEYICGDTFRNNEDRTEFMNKVMSAGVLPYTARDYIEFKIVVDFLSDYHPKLKTR